MSIEDQIKECIIESKGMRGVSPSDLRNVDDLKVNYLFDDNDFLSLCESLQDLLQQNGSVKIIKCKDVSGCDSVQDVIDLYNKVLNS